MVPDKLINDLVIFVPLLLLLGWIISGLHIKMFYDGLQNKQCCNLDNISNVFIGERSGVFSEHRHSNCTCLCLGVLLSVCQFLQHIFRFLSICWQIAWNEWHNIWHADASRWLIAIWHPGYCCHFMHFSIRPTVHELGFWYNRQIVLKKSLYFGTLMYPDDLPSVFRCLWV